MLRALGVIVVVVGPWAASLYLIAFAEAFATCPNPSAESALLVLILTNAIAVGDAVGKVRLVRVYDNDGMVVGAAIGLFAIDLIVLAVTSLVAALIVSCASL